MSSTRELARRLPDLPRWVEVRDCLLSGDCEVFGLTETPALALVVRDPATDFIMIVGAPQAIAIQSAAAANAGRGDLVAPPEHADLVARALPHWRRTRAVLH